MYLALERPWSSSGDPEAALDAGAAPDDAGPAKVAKGKKRGKPRRKRGGGGAVVADPGDQPIVLSDADKRMVWRGDTVQLPPAMVDLNGGGGEDARSLDDGEIGATLDRNGGGLQRCVEQALGGAPYSGTVTVKLLVGGDGKATKTRVHAPSFMQEAGLLSCVRGAARKLGFPAVGGSTVVTIPFPIEL
ncbi:MAG: hypothetical protein H6709_08370 [Kofleriaceae bacterium]|nr:hypothetical protein [Myxococcales bacterium]MCB9562301.1 hypothetical protein [Kofleriaceae bacterium]MCB9572091.1 hypothetical protein [Kofleriaceae bacterium]